MVQLPGLWMHGMVQLLSSKWPETPTPLALHAACDFALLLPVFAIRSSIELGIEISRSKIP